MKEVFRDIEGYEFIYQVSNLGNVKSLDRKVIGTNGIIQNLKGKVLKSCKNSNGYEIVSLHRNGKHKTNKVHQLVAVAFLSHIKCGYNKVVDHINNIRLDNRLENLQIISQRENCSKDKKEGSSKFIGVSWDKNAKKWRPSIRYNKKSYHLGSFSSEEEASKVYQNKLKEIING